jgi:hypothetical protein
MNFEDLVEAQSIRPKKEANKLAKKKRTRAKKRKDGGPEASVPEQTAEAAPVDQAAEPDRSPHAVTEIQHREGLLVPRCGVAPIARTWKLDNKETELALVGSIVEDPSEASTCHCVLAVGGFWRNNSLVVRSEFNTVQRICSAIVRLPLMACSKRKVFALCCRPPDPVCFNSPI